MPTNESFDRIDSRENSLQRHLSRENSSGLVCSNSSKPAVLRSKALDIDKLTDQKLGKLKTSSTKVNTRSPVKASKYGIKQFLCLKGKPNIDYKSPRKKVKSVREKIVDFESKIDNNPSQVKSKDAKNNKVTIEDDKKIKMKSEKIKRIAEMFEMDNTETIDDKKEANSTGDDVKVKDAFKILMMLRGDTPDRKTPRNKSIKKVSARNFGRK